MAMNSGNIWVYYALVVSQIDRNFTFNAQFIKNNWVVHFIMQFEYYIAFPWRRAICRF